MKWLWIFSVVLIGGCATEQTQHPRERLVKPSRAERAAGLPTLRWELDHETGVTYDVVVYEVLQLDLSWIPGRLVAYAENLATTAYTVPQPLPPGKYCWSVRVRRGSGVEPWQIRGGTAMEGLLLTFSEGQFARFRIRED